MWAPWCEETAERLEKASGKTLSDVFYDFVNYDKKSQKFGRSKLAHDTNAVLKDQLAEILNKQHGINLDDANSFISYAWTDTFSTGDSHTNAVKPLGDVRTIFQTLKEYGIKVAVCTSDTRPSAKLALKSLGVADIVDRLVCGDDPDNTPKPAPDNVHMICKDLDVKVEDAVMIGDTHFDTVMGRDSKCGTVIGVLTGQVDESELDDAHYVVNSIDEALPILLKNSAK
ncbi:pyrophosphatase PpaX-like isoform X2 [Styela clava]